MPRLVRWYIKASLVWLVIALIVRVLAAFSNITFFTRLDPAIWHMLLVGWLTQLIFGVAHWMFPTRPRGDRTGLRGDEQVIWAVWGLLNVGLLLRVIAEPLQAVQSTRWTAVALVLSALLQWLAGVGFVWNTWPRVRPPRRATREA